MGCTARGGDSIHIKKRLLAIAAIGAVLVITAVTIASLKGNDKPEISTNLPPASEQPASTPQTSVSVPGYDHETDILHGRPVVAPTTDTGNNGNGNGNGNGGGNGNGNGNGNGHSGSDDNQAPTDDAKLHGLERAIEVHLRNMEKQDAKGVEQSSSHDGKGLENSLEQLQDNLAKHTSTESVSLGHGNGHGQANGQSHNT